MYFRNFTTLFVNSLTFILVLTMFMEVRLRKEINISTGTSVISYLITGAIPTAFHGFDSEDTNRWLDKVENYLTLRRIDTSTPTALAELVPNLAGPAEDFYYFLTWGL